MNLSKFFDLKFWLFDSYEYNQLYSYDLKFNESFRSINKLSPKILKSDELRCIKLYRKAQVTKNTIWYKLYFYRLKKLGIRTGINLWQNMNIGKGLIIGHSGTIILNSNASFGNNIFLTHGVTIGRDVRGKRKGSPIIGNNVCIRCNSTIVGKITIGDDVLIAPNTFVNFDVPNHSIVIGNPATIHHREDATKDHLGKVE